MTTITKPRIIKASDENLDATDGAWIAMCDAHGTAVNFPTRSAARAVESTEEICNYCHDEARGVSDMATEFAADEEAEQVEEAPAAPAVLEASPSRISDLLAEISRLAEGKQIAARNAAIQEARSLKISRAEIAQAAGVSINYLQHILKPAPKTPKAPALTKFQQGYAEALSDLLDQINAGKTRDESLLLVEEWISNNGRGLAASKWAALGTVGA